MMYGFVKWVSAWWATYPSLRGVISARQRLMNSCYYDSEGLLMVCLEPAYDSGWVGKRSTGASPYPPYSDQLFPNPPCDSRRNGNNREGYNEIRTLEQRGILGIRSEVGRCYTCLTPRTPVRDNPPPGRPTSKVLLSIIQCHPDMISLVLATLGKTGCEKHKHRKELPCLICADHSWVVVRPIESNGLPRLALLILLVDDIIP